MNKINNHLVSIAIATYNGEKYLVEQLESIYNQTYKNIEVVVSDDNSKDSTPLILENYSKKFGLIYNLNESNIGIIQNFEKAIRQCSGRYIILCDQDDIWMPSKIEILVQSIGEYSLIYSDGYIIKEGFLQQQKISHLKWMYPFGIDSCHHNFLKYITFNSFILGCSLMFKRELLITALPFFDNYRNHDWWLVFCAENDCGIKYINKPLFYYRIHNENFSIKPKLSLRNKLLSSYSHDRLTARKLLHNKQVEIYNFLSVQNFYNDPDRYYFLNKINNAYENKSSVTHRFSYLFFLIRYAKYIFPKNNIFAKVIKIIIRFIEF